MELQRLAAVQAAGSGQARVLVVEPGLDMDGEIRGLNKLDP